MPDVLLALVGVMVALTLALFVVLLIADAEADA